MAGQTSRPNGLNFFVDTHGWPGGVKGYKKRNFNKKKCSRATPGPSASQ